MLHFTERTCKSKNVSNWPKTSFFHQTKAFSDSTFCSESLFWSENAWFYWNSEYFSFKVAKRCISQEGLANAKMSQICLKQDFFHQTKALSDSTFCSASLFWSGNAWFYWNCEYFSFKVAKRCISQKGLVNAKMSQIGLKQAKQKHFLTQLFVLHHYTEAKTRDVIEIVSILASKSQNAAFHRKDL